MRVHEEVKNANVLIHFHLVAFFSRADSSRKITMVKSNEADLANATEEQLGAHPSRIPTHPEEKAKLPAPNVVPDGVSPPIRHPLDPLNAGKCFYPCFRVRSDVSSR